MRERDVSRFALEVGEARSYGAGLSSSQFNNETVVALYRFAFLLTGGERAAQQLLVDTLTVCASEIEQIRNEKNRTVFFVRKLRERCVKTSADRSEKSEGREMTSAVAFSAMPEPERSALSLFYLDLFPTREIASLLGIGFDDLSEALDDGREFLRRSGALQAAASSQENA